MNDRRDTIGLYLEIDAAEGAETRLQAALGCAPVQAVLIATAAGRRLDRAMARPLIELAQRCGAAALVEADSRLAADLGADGVHLPCTPDGMEAFAAARAVLGPDRIVGTMVQDSRHDAMELGEAGADYVGFGGPDAALRADMIEWWAEVFEVPCVAFGVADAEAAREVADAGADFIGIAHKAGETAKDYADRVRAIAEILGIAGLHPGEHDQRSGA